MSNYVYALLLTLFCLSPCQASDNFWDDPRDVKVFATNAQGETVRVATPLMEQKMDQALQKFVQDCDAGRPDQASTTFKNAIILCPVKSLRTHGYIMLASLCMDLNSFRVAYFYALDHGNAAPMLFEQYSLRYRHILDGGAARFQEAAHGINEEAMRQSLQASARSGLEAIKKIIFEEAKRKSNQPELERHPLEEKDILVQKLKSPSVLDVAKASYVLFKLGLAVVLTYKIILTVISWI